MIQRIQSIFLFLASGSCFGLFGTDMADTPQPMVGSDLFADASFDLFDDPVLIGAFALAGVLFLANIFLFKNRPLQMKINIVAAFALSVGVGYGLVRLFTDSAAASAVPDFGVAFPILALIFGYLAGRYIKSDEKLVRSADRLR